MSEQADTNIATEDRIDDAQSVDGCVLIERAVAFFLGGQRYALPLERVNEIQQIVAFSETPEGQSSVVGMVNLRGSVIPAVDMRILVGLEPQEYTLETPMIITETHGQTVALIVDEVQDVLELPPGCLQDAPPLHALSSKMIGVCRMPDGLMNLLDIDLLLGLDRFRGGR
jgi:purine-binding chemotaxis protein CheW